MPTQISGTTGVSAVQSGVIQASDFEAALFAASLTDSGYQKLPSGLIIQWGSQTLTGVANGTWNSGTYWFPTPFTTACLSFVVTNSNNNSLSATPVWIIGNGGSATQYTISAMSSTASQIAGIVAKWIAVGY